jgi:hypothetical protein
MTRPPSATVLGGGGVSVFFRRPHPWAALHRMSASRTTLRRRRGGKRIMCNMGNANKGLASIHAVFHVLMAVTALNPCRAMPV